MQLHRELTLFSYGGTPAEKFENTCSRESAEVENG
jgi:hypothetical protein